VLASEGASPYRDGLAALQDRVVPEKRGEFRGGEGAGRGQRGKGEESAC
jgi:hypothetical protein